MNFIILIPTEAPSRIWLIIPPSTIRSPSTPITWSCPVNCCRWRSCRRRWGGRRCARRDCGQFDPGQSCRSRRSCTRRSRQGSPKKWWRRWPCSNNWCSLGCRCGTFLSFKTSSDKNTKIIQKNRNYKTMWTNKFIQTKNFTENICVVFWLDRDRRSFIRWQLKMKKIAGSLTGSGPEMTEKMRFWRWRLQPKTF